jgi:hypothetical protein
MTTFSQLIDAAIQECKRPDMLAEIVTYANQTIREMHFRPDLNAPLLYRSNFKEFQFIALSESATWDIPNPAIFQRLSAVRYPDVYRSDGDNWSKEKVPGRGISVGDLFHYSVGGSYAFSGFGAAGSRIQLGYHEFPRRHKYHPPAIRPASFDDELGWTYRADVVTEEARELARLACTNWLIMRWSDVLLEGLRAKIYKRVSDQDRQRTAYSLYQQLRQGVWLSELPTLGG